MSAANKVEIFLRGKEEPQVSVVIPVYNRSELLKELLRSLARQTLARDRYEVIVIDDGSTEDLRALVADMSRRESALQLVYARQANAGPARARNAGMELARGAIIGLIDSDCRAHPQWLEKALPRFEESEVGAVEGRTIVPQADQITPFTHQTENLNGGRYPTCNFLLRRGIARFYEGYRLAFREDSDLAFTILRSGKTIAFEPAAVVYHPCLPGSLWMPFRLARRYEYDGLLRARHPDLYRTHLDRFPIGRLRIPHLRRYIYLSFVCALALAPFSLHPYFTRFWSAYLPSSLPAFGMIAAAWSANFLLQARTLFARPRLWRYIPFAAALAFLVPPVFCWYFFKGLIRFRRSAIE